MPYLRVSPQSDDRRAKQGCAPIRLVNCLVRRTPEGDAKALRAPYFIAPTPGRTLRATMTDNVRGLFSAPGCRNGNVFVAHGSTLSEMTDNYSPSAVGTLPGGDVVTMRADRSNLAIRAFGTLKQWDGSTLGSVTDTDAPAFAQTLAVVARRWVAAAEDNDVFNWSKAGLYNDWDPNGQAVDQDLPDQIVGQEEIAGELWSFNKVSTQIWQPTGGPEATAFARVPGVSIPRGLAGRDAIATFGAGKMLLGHTRQVFGTAGYDLQPIPNPALEQDLKALSNDEIEACVAWSYLDGGKEFWGLNTGLETAHVRDGETGLWHERSSYGDGAYDIDFAAAAFGRVFVASRQSPYLWSLEDDVFTDAGNPIQRTWTVHIPSVGDVPVSRIVWDMVTLGVPVTGDGSSPVMQVRTSNDNGESWSDWRDIALPRPANKFRIQDFAFGLASHEHGMLIEHRLTDPIGYNFLGLWVNPTEEELSA